MAPPPLLAHLKQFVLHAQPHTAEVDRIHSVELFTCGVGSLNSQTLHTGVVEGCIQASECGDGLFNHCLYLSFIGDIAGDCDCFVTGGSQAVRCSWGCRLIDVNPRYCSAFVSKCLRCR